MNHKDANLKSYRSTGGDGAVLGDGSLGVDRDKIETDADGKSVGLSAPITYPTNSNDLYASGWSFGTISNGQFMTYSVDGIHVPPEFAMDRLGAGTPGFELNLLSFSVTMSQRIREWRFTGQDGFDRTFPVGQVPQRAVDMLNRGLANAYAILDNSWSALDLLATRVQRQNDVPPPEIVKIFNDSLKEMAGRLRKKKCYETLGFKSKSEVEKFLAKKNQFNLFKSEPKKIEGPSYEQYTAPVAQTDTVTNKIHVNVYGGFFAGFDGYVKGPNNKRYYLGPVRDFFTEEYDSINSFANDTVFRAFVLLHEVSHSTGKSGLDAGDITKQAENNDNVLKNCFGVTSFKDRQGNLYRTFK